MPQPTEPHPDDLLTAAECCRLLKISRRSFQRLREQRRLPEPAMHTSSTLMRWRRGDILTALLPIPSLSTPQSKMLTALSHLRAAAMKARAAASHADLGVTVLREIAAEMISPNAVATQPHFFHEGAD